MDDARRIVEQYVVHYNTVRLHSAVGYVTPADVLAGREQAIFAKRDQKLAEARERRQKRRLGQENDNPAAMAANSGQATCQMLAPGE